MYTDFELCLENRSGIRSLGKSVYVARTTNPACSRSWEGVAGRAYGLSKGQAGCEGSRARPVCCLLGGEMLSHNIRARSLGFFGFLNDISETDMVKQSGEICLQTAAGRCRKQKDSVVLCSRPDVNQERG